MRIGIGYDIHRFHGKRPLKLGGITIPSARGLAGHSDADVLLHAVADALLGAIGAPDLGEQFPPGDQRFRNADSRTFVKAAYAQARRKGWAVENLDATVIADAPRLMGYKGRMQKAIGMLLAVTPDRISVKAKTTEGFSPAAGGIAAQAVVLLRAASRAAAAYRRPRHSRRHPAHRAGAPARSQAARRRRR